MKDTHELHLREHRFILGLIELLERKLEAGETHGIEVTLNTLAQRLRLHLKIEEERVFPAIEAKLAEPGFAPLAIFCREHNALRSLLNVVVHAVEGGGGAAAALDVRELGMAFRLHSQEEEVVLYPMLDRTFDVTARAALDRLLTGDAP